MSNPRGLANHSLYMARLLLLAWEEAHAAALAPVNALDAAFAPAIRLHLLDAYGWFLLATLRVTQLPVLPPHRVTDLAPQAPGISRPAEISECQQLEQGGWLAQLQTQLPTGLAKRSRGISLAIDSAYPDIAFYQDCAAHFDVLFARMSDAIDEY